MPSVNPSNLAFEGIHLTQSDFVAGKDEGETLNAGDVGEVATAEINEDGQLASYEALRLGDSMDPTGNSSKGKLYVELSDTNDAVVGDSVQFRWVVRDKNSNRRQPVTRWYAHRGQANSDPRLRTPLAPVTHNNKPFFAKSGRLLVLEVKNESDTVEVTLGNSVFEIPSRAGY